MKAFILRYAKSLRFRLFLVLLLVGIVPLNVLTRAILDNYVTQQIDQRVKLIQDRSRMIADDIVQEGYLEGRKSSSLQNQLTQLGSIWNGRVVLVNDRFRIVTDTFNNDEGKIIIAKKVLTSFKGNYETNYNSKLQYLEVTVPVRDSDTGNTAGILIVSAQTNDIDQGMKNLANRAFFLQLIMTILILAVAFYMARVLVRPFGKVTASLNQKNQFLGEDISIPDYTETKLLADAYNSMRKRLREQEDTRQEFVSNVSHELKTPITSMKVLADSLLAQEEVPAELYREFLQDIADEIDRENKIITDLLELVKMDRKASDVHIKETNINDLIDLILKRLRPIAAKQNIELVLENYKPIMAEVDETKLTLAISNLVENAIKYNKPDGWVHVSLNMDSSFFFIKVEDSGIGIPEADQASIFERFYRVDKSHSREIGGTGLGLAITRSAVLMHHGALKVYSKEGEGTTFTVRIPLKYVANEAGGQGGADSGRLRNLRKKSKGGADRL